MPSDSSTKYDEDTIIYNLTFYVPQTHTSTCLQALWFVGAGTWPNAPLPNGEKDLSAAKYIGAPPSPHLSTHKGLGFEQDYGC
jgi:hypothetical protein